jgi:acyl-CoA thioesterase II
MHARTWLGLEETDDPLRYRMPVTPAVSSGMGALFGGAGLAAGIEAMETASGRPVIWATAQYLSYARPPAVLDIEVVLAVTGHQVTQARAIARVDGDEILTVNAALGVRPLELQGQWAVMPVVPRPGDSPPRRHYRPHPEDSLATRIEARMAKGRMPEELDGVPGDGRTAMWARIPDVEVGSTTLAVLGDFVPSGIGQALGLPAGGNSLDNTLRVNRIVPTDWVLLDIRIHGVDHGFGHGLVHLWAEDGTLLGTASQSAIVRYWKDRQR